MKIEIVNVIEVINDVLTSVDSFVITSKKSRQKIAEKAEALFVRKAKENGMEDDEAEDCLDNGFYEAENMRSTNTSYTVYINWSNVQK